MRFELPLLKRELIEAAQHKRTYLLRVILMLVMALVYLLVYASITHRQSHPLQILGHGSELTLALFIFVTCSLYVILPAMACSAITVEKEKQTLGLLLASRLSPGMIILEKVSSRIMPMVSLLIIATPMFAVAYLFGGVTLAYSLTGIAIELMIALHVVSLAVFCSTVFNSGLKAFWATYIILCIWYFTLPIWYELTRMRPFNGPDTELLLCGWYPLMLLLENRSLTGAVLPSTIPMNVATVVLLIASRFTLVRFGYGSATSFEVLLAKLFQKFMRVFNFFTRWPRRLLGLVGIRSSHSPADAMLDWHTRDRPISWRERRRSFLNRKGLLAGMIGVPVFIEALIMIDASRASQVAEEVSAFFSIGMLVIILLITMGLSCRLFATERERQTLDSLLTVPLSTREILNQKLSGINRLALVALIPIILAGIMNIFNTDVEVFSEAGIPGARTHSWRRDVGIVQPMSFYWFNASMLFMICVIGNTLIYIQIVKWISVYFGLRLQSQMKAMLASLLSIVGLCLLPMMMTALVLISLDCDPDDFPLFFFSSPAITVCMNELHELHEYYRRSWFPESDWLVVLFNFMVYGGLALALRTFVLVRLNHFLQRKDSPAYASTAPDVFAWSPQPDSWLPVDKVNQD